MIDESTSALDATSRLLVSEAVRRRRKNKTTVVITHDLSQIERGDFIYALKNGRVVEQGYRSDLEKVEGGEWRILMDSQMQTKGGNAFMATTNLNADLQEPTDNDNGVGQTADSKHQRLKRPSTRPLTIGGFTFDLLSGVRKSTVTRKPKFIPCNHGSLMPVGASGEITPHQTLRHVSSAPFPTVEHDISSRNLTVDMETLMLQRTGAEASRKRRFDGDIQDRRMCSLDRPSSPFEIVPNPHHSSEHDQEPFWRLISDMYPSIPHIPWIVVGLIVCILSGAMTPIFSSLLSRLLFEVSIGASNVSAINRFGSMVLGAAALDGIFIGLKYFIMETVSTSWVTRLRS